MEHEIRYACSSGVAIADLDAAGSWGTVGTRIAVAAGGTGLALEDRGERLKGKPGTRRLYVAAEEAVSHQCRSIPHD